MKITIKDIAKLAGVTHPTVSKALNGEPGVGEKTRKKIIAIAEQLNYTPNLAAKRLVDRRTNCIGLIWPDSESLFFYSLFRKIQKAASKRGFTVILSLAPAEEALRTFSQHFVDHIIFWCTPRWKPSNEFIKQKELFHGQLLLMGGGEMEGAHCITIDRKTGVYDAVEHLAALGHRRITFVGEHSDKLIGFTQGMLEFKLEYHPDYIVIHNDRNPDLESKMAELFNREANPTAYVIDSHTVLTRFVKCARRHNIRIPEDISIVVYDDIPETDVLEIALTAVGPSIEQLADRALDILEQEQDREQTEEQEWVNEEVAAKLIIRQSTKTIF